MQSTTQFTYDQKQPMSWLQFIGSFLFAFYGTRLISELFIGLPVLIYSEGVTDQKQITLITSIQDTGNSLLLLGILLLFIYKYEPLRNLIVPTINFKALKKVSTYIYLFLFFGLSIVINSFILIHLFPEATKEQSSALNLEVLKQYKLLLLLGSAVFIPIFEELICRGIILHFFQQRFPFWLAAIGSSFLFGIGHTYSLGVMVTTFIMGLFMAVLCKKTNSIIPAILFHMMNNTLAFL